MAKQVEPFKQPITLGYFVFCRGEDFYEPEGIVYFNEEPKIGDTATLSDKQLWKVVRESNERMEITMERVEE